MIGGDVGGLIRRYESHQAKRPLGPITTRQQSCLDFIVRFQAEHGCAPTIREIADMLGVRSTNGVVDHLRALVRRGHIEDWRATSAPDGKRRCRSIIVTNAAPTVDPPVALTLAALRAAAARVERADLSEAELAELRALHARIGTTAYAVKERAK